MKKVLPYIRILVSFGFIALLVWLMRDKLGEIGEVLLNTNLTLFFMCWFTYVAVVFFQAFRLQLILAAQDMRLPLLKVFRLSLLGLFFNNFLPTVVGGDAVKAVYASGATNRKLESFTAVFVDRLLGLVTLMFLAVSALCLSYGDVENKAIFVIVGAMFAVSFFFTIIIFNKPLAKKLMFLKPLLEKFKLEDKMRRLYEAASRYRRHKRLIIYALLLSISLQVVSILAISFLGSSISANVRIVRFFLALPVVSAVSMLPSINGLGIREGGFVYCLGPYMGVEGAFALSLLWLAIYLGTSLFGGVVFAFEKRK